MKGREGRENMCECCVKGKQGGQREEMYVCLCERR